MKNEKLTLPRFLSGNVIKILAIVTMLIDHAGLMLFSGNLIMRSIGRISFPLFAFLLAEGCYYTKHKLRHFLEIFILGLLCQIVYLFQSGDWFLNILITFSLSIPLVYSVNLAKVKPRFVFLPILGIAIAYFITEILPELLPKYSIVFDYGFIGVLTPVAVSLFKNKWLKLISLSLALTFLSIDIGGYQRYCLLAVIPLAFYNGKRGKLKLKYTFYVFYPVHLAILYLISILI